MNGKEDDFLLNQSRPRRALDAVHGGADGGVHTAKPGEYSQQASPGSLTSSMLRRTFSENKYKREVKKLKKFDHSLDAYLNRLWSTIFGDGTSVLLSPGEILRERRDRSKVRAQELSCISLAEKDLKAVHAGSKTIDEYGYIKDSSKSPSDDIKMSSLIERHEGSADDVELRLGANALLKHISHEVRIKELKRSLHIRKVAIFAERQAIANYDGRCSEREIDLDWVERWKEYAQDTHAQDVQKLWASVLAKEVLKPGSVSLMSLDFLRNLSSSDLELIKIAAKYSFDTFIYREAKGYFTEDIHYVMFERLEEMGLIQDVKRGGGWKLFIEQGASIESCNTVLRCHNKALFVEVLYPGQGLSLPVFAMTLLGREVLSVTGVDADMAYLWAVANDIKSKGCSVQLGDWLERPGAKGAFQQKIII